MAFACVGAIPIMKRFDSSSFVRALVIVTVVAGSGACTRRSNTAQAPAHTEPAVAEPVEAEEADVPEQPFYLYTATEQARIAHCVALGETVWIVTNHQRLGTPKEQILAHDSGSPVDEVVRSIVDRAYAEPAGPPFDRTVAFYQECTVKGGEVPEDRSGMAVYCLIHTLVARITWERKTEGKALEEVVAALHQLPDVVPVIAAAYESTLPRGELLFHMWDECMAPLVDPES